MLITVLSGFILALATVILGKRIKGTLSPLVSILPVALLGYFISFTPSIIDGVPLLFSYNWIPSLGINLSFNLDGLSFLFALLITGIGSLVFIYSSSYLKGHAQLDRFYAYLSMFMGSMLGLVLSDNMITLFIFWELTSISSFFLIGFNHESAASRKAALTALGITGIGGLFLLTSMVILGTSTGTYNISELLSSPQQLEVHKNYYWIIICLMFAAFTKSAQFPFHFWLPGAMKAPTPVSTYLHSATMVKAGIYLLARFTPILGGTPAWNHTLLVIGGITMVYAAVHALFRVDLKGILAYSTISALGILVFLLGLGTEEAILAAMVFILVHALYKATLFLVTGIIDKKTGTRNVTELAGLNGIMLPVGIAAILAAISSAGIPPSLGFVGKELIYESTLHHSFWPIALTSAAIITNFCLLFAGFQAGIRPFVGKLPEKWAKLPAPDGRLWVPPALLALLGVLVGIYPTVMESSLIQPSVTAIYGKTFDGHLQLWHGFNTVLLLSLLTMAIGFFMYYSLKPSEQLLGKALRWEKISPQHLTEKLAGAFQALSQWVTQKLQNGYLRYYLIVVLCFVSILLFYKIYHETNIYLDVNKLSALTLYEVVVLLIMFFAIFLTVFSQSRLVAVASLGVIGYGICLVFLFYSAPDLAMTQFSIDTLTVILFVLVLYNLPKYLNLSENKERLRDGLLALIFGAMISILTLEVLNEPLSRETSEYYAEHAYTAAHGKNVVNVILVDFRGFDTMVEITVLAIAALGVYSLLKLKLKNPEKE